MSNLMKTLEGGPKGTQEGGSMEVTESRDKTCDNCKNQGHFRAMCRSGVTVNATGDRNLYNERNSLGVVGALPNHGNNQSFMVVCRGSGRQMHKIRLQPNQAVIPHM